MTWTDSISLAGVYRQLYVAILQSYVPHGKRGDFARKVGITREYLSYLCDLRGSLDPSKARKPSPEMAEKIAAALPAPLEVRQTLLEAMLLSRQAVDHGSRAVRQYLAERESAVLLSDLTKSHQLASFGRDYDKVHQAYRLVRDLAATLVNGISITGEPWAYARACLCLCDTQCVLDRADDALRWAKLARLAMEYADTSGDSDTRKKFHEVDIEFPLELDLLRAEGIAYHNLGLERDAYALYQQAMSSNTYRQMSLAWRMALERDILNALANIPRFSIRQATQIYHDICRNSERSGFKASGGSSLTILMGKESYIRCLIKYEKWKTAQHLERELLDQLDSDPAAGALHRALILKTCAQLSWQRDDQAGWREKITRAAQLMLQAGLNHQLRLVQQDYQEHLKPILEAITPDPEGF
jgi:hypothetical protein